MIYFLLLAAVRLITPFSLINMNVNKQKRFEVTVFMNSSAGYIFTQLYSAVNKLQCIKSQESFYAKDHPHIM